MPRHPLLPKDYGDSATQAAIIFALGPYKISDRNDINNPQMKWNLTKAWQAAEALLARGGGWKSLAPDDTSQTGYEMAADSEKEMDDLNTVIAGLVAYQIMEPDSGVFIRRIEYKKGGEVSIVISSRTATKLQELFPHVLSSSTAEPGLQRWWSIGNWKKWIKLGNTP